MSDTLSLSHPAIADLSHCIGQRVRIHGFVDAIRDQKRMHFIVLRDQTGKVQLAQSEEGSLKRHQRTLGSRPNSSLVETARAEVEFG